MLGENVKQPFVAGLGDELLVREVFSTIQGEGPFSGQPAVFVRLGGCNLACWYCDTDFDSVSSTTVSVDSLVRSVVKMMPGSGTRKTGRPLCVLTGGEPLRQPVGKLVSDLVVAGVHVQVETAGLLWRPELGLFSDSQLTVVCSPKTPTVHPSMIERVSAWKYVLRAEEVDGRDGLPSLPADVDSRATWSKGRGTGSGPPGVARPPDGARVPVYVMPCDEGDEPSRRVNYEACVASALRFGYAVCLQQHKLLGVR